MIEELGQCIYQVYHFKVYSNMFSVKKTILLGNFKWFEVYMGFHSHLSIVLNRNMESALTV